MNPAALVRTRLEELLAEADPAGSRTPFMAAQFDFGLAWVQFPIGHGGLAVQSSLQTLVDTTLDATTQHRPRRWDILGHGMGAPMLVEHGTEAQLRRWLRPMFTGDEIWCQMFSEPGAGSDVASLSTQAIRDGDEWVVNGQKVWTTAAHVAKWGMLLARTDQQAPKHRGMTFFVVDMESDGIEVRPLRQITGEAEFNEVFLTDVRVGRHQMIGEPGDGWRVALTILMNERVAIGARDTERNSGAIADLLEVWRARGGPAPTRDRVARLWIEAEVNRLTNLRALQNRAKGTPGPEGSTAKLVYAELNKEIYDLVMDVSGPDAMLYGGYEHGVPRPGSEADQDVRRSFLRSRANSIEGGTSEVMKNILGERVLGLPAEPRQDRETPWSALPPS